MKNYFKDKSILITGAASGIGKELALEFAKNGANLFLWDINESALNDVAETCKKDSPKVLTSLVDVTDREKVQMASNEINYVDIVIANAGIGGINPAENFDISIDEKIMAVNYRGTVNTIAPFLNDMVKRRHGHIVGIASMAYTRGLPSACSYSASKAAQVNFLEALRLDLKGYNIFVSIIVPGFIQTKMAEHNEFEMPFKVSPKKSAKLILKAIAKKRRSYWFPWQMAILSLINRFLPSFISDRILIKLNPPKEQRVPKIF